MATIGKNGMHKSIAFEKVSVADAKRVLDGAPRTPVTANMSSRRGIRKDDSLRTSTGQWIVALPAEVQPRELALRYARIANAICSLWGHPDRCARYLADLLISRRGNRRGFPGEVAAEIANLATHYEALHPRGRPWV